MNLIAYIMGESGTRLWGLSSRQRLTRQLRQVGDIPVLDTLEQLPVGPPGLKVLLVRSDYLFETRTLAALAQHTNVILVDAEKSHPAAAIVDAESVQLARGLLEGETQAGAELLETIDPDALWAFDSTLRRSESPLLEHVSEQRRQQLENQLYGNAYKGITDFVTKWVWPRPARFGVRVCTSLSLTPNAVTLFGLALMLAACWLFWRGDYALGLVLGWFMTYLDTVDGKLARVTVKSSRFGHLLDHGMDIVHPPFWYIYWGLSLTGFSPWLGLDVQQLNWLIVITYTLGRVVEGAFEVILRCEVFSWRPFDSYFRLVTARRNPCLVLLTAGLLLGRPDWGFIAVAIWTAVTTAVLVLRLIQGSISRARGRRLESWLNDAERARREHPAAYRTFSGTRAAYGGA
ncbi:MAG: CDP-alcohol phosphatidyltransferase family protein [Gammaproteobacteria bacterium]